MDIIKNFKIKNLDNKKYQIYEIYIAIKSAGRRNTISLLVRYNAYFDLRSFCCTTELSNSFSQRAISPSCLLSKSQL